MLRSIAFRTSRTLAPLALTATLFVAAPARALAHTGENVPLSHVILEVGQWSLGAAAIVGALVGILWLRARLRGPQR